MNRPTLLIDAGNTRIKFGLALEPNAPRESATLALAHSELNRLSEWLGTLPQPPGAALGVTVASTGVTSEIEGIVARLCGVKVRWISSSRSAGGVVNLYEEPTRLGADRWVALIGLAARTPQAAMLASFGTATTIDTLGPGVAVTTARRFEGGVILPGPELMLQSLANGTAQLPYAEGPVAGLPRNTHTAIRSGVVAAQVGAVLNQWHATMAALKEPPRLFCAGGGWPMVAEQVIAELARCRATLGLPLEEPEWLDAPVLDGLARLYAEAQNESL